MITIEKALEIIALQAERILTLESKNQTIVSELKEMQEKKEYWLDEWLNLSNQLQNTSEKSVISLEDKEAV